MNPGWEESEYVFCDLQSAARYIRRDNCAASRVFLEAAYDTFQFLAVHPGIGRRRHDLGFPEVRSWRVNGFRRYLVLSSIASFPTVSKFGAFCMELVTYKRISEAD